MQCERLLILPIQTAAQGTQLPTRNPTHLLVATLDGAVALKHVHDVSLVVGQDLHLDVARALNEPLNEDSAVAERSQSLAAKDEKLRRQIRQPWSYTLEGIVWAANATRAPQNDRARLRCTCPW